jgi:hypothetical protein
MLRWAFGTFLATTLIFGGVLPVNANPFDDETDSGVSLVKGGKGKGKKKGGKKKAGKKKGSRKHTASA